MQRREGGGGGDRAVTALQGQDLSSPGCKPGGCEERPDQAPEGRPTAAEAVLALAGAVVAHR